MDARSVAPSVEAQRNEAKDLFMAMRAVSAKDGREVDLSTVWLDRKVVLIFLRHMVRGFVLLFFCRSRFGSWGIRLCSSNRQSFHCAVGLQFLLGPAQRIEEDCARSEEGGCIRGACHDGIA